MYVYERTQMHGAKNKMLYLLFSIKLNKLNKIQNKATYFENIISDHNGRPRLFFKRN